MSEPKSSAEPSATTSFLNSKLGPLPLWIWLAGAGVGLLIWREHQSNSAASSAPSVGTGSSADTSAADIPQFVNQTYTTVQPPSVTVSPSPVNVSTPVTVNNPAPPASKPATPSKPVAKNPAHSSAPVARKPPTANHYIDGVENGPANPWYTYTVVRGDTLWGIADRTYHNAEDWKKLYAINKSRIGSNPGKIYPGEKIWLPKKI